MTSSPRSSPSARRSASSDPEAAQRTGLAEVTLRTAGMSIAHLDSPRSDPDYETSCSASAYAGERTGISEGLQAAAVGSDRWFGDPIGYLGGLVETQGGGNAYETPTHMAASEVRGGVLGLTFGHGSAEMARAVGAGVLPSMEAAAEAMVRTERVSETDPPRARGSQARAPGRGA